MVALCCWFCMRGADSFDSSRIDCAARSKVTINSDIVGATRSGIRSNPTFRYLFYTLPVLLRQKSVSALKTATGVDRSYTFDIGMNTMKEELRVCVGSYRILEKCLVKVNDPRAIELRFVLHGYHNC